MFCFENSCGKVKSMKAIIDKQTNKCKGFGFIDFETNEDAQLAITQLQNKGYTAQLAKVNNSCSSTRENIPIVHLVFSTTRTRYN